MNDEINSPAHYKLFPDMEVIDIIRAVLTPEEFAGYCKGNSMKYRLRAGSKGPADVCIGKARVYDGWLRGSPEPSPWYPDDSGEWVEVVPGSGMPDGLAGITVIDFLEKHERDRKEFATISGAANRWNWRSNGDSTIVAYKLAK